MGKQEGSCESKQSFSNVNNIITEFEESVIDPIKPGKEDKLYVGVDLGTAYIVLVVLDENKKPIAGAYRFAQVVKDGLVVDYLGALNIVRQLKKEVEDKIQRDLTHAAVAIPPGTTVNDTRYISNVVEGAGFEVSNVIDEPSAANSLLGIKNGVVVDIGGGTTGLAVIKGGKIVYIADEPTGGTQCTLVVAGTYKIPFEEAEKLKQDPKKQEEIASVLKPVSQKIASIIKKHIENFDIDAVYLVGGTSCLLNIEKVIEKEIGISTYKPKNPIFVTPIELQ